MNQAVRDKLTFSCTDEATKSKLYDVGSDLTLDRAIEILYQKETTKYELQESKSAHIDVVKKGQRRRLVRVVRVNRPQNSTNPASRMIKLSVGIAVEIIQRQEKVSRCESQM